MNSLACSRIAVLTAIMTGGSLAGAAPLHNVCVPSALGVPTRFMEPPKWVAWTGAPGVLSSASEALDDPRWQGAAGEEFGINSPTLGSAKAPLQLRMLWSHQDQDYLYMSFIMDVEGLTGLPGTGSETPRDLFLGFHRSTVFDPGTPGDPTDDQHGYVFQFHLTRGDSPDLVEPVYCTRALDSSAGAGDGCAEAGGANSNPKNYWRLYADLGQTGATCGSATAEHFTAVTAGDTAASWVASKQAVRFWKLSTANRWAVLLRIPLTDPGHPLSDGIDRASTFWYEATAQTNSDDFVNLGWWPREITSSVCVSLLAGGFLDHKELDNPDHYSRLSEVASAGAPGCDGGIAIDASRIGSIPDFTGAPADLATADLTGAVNFKALRADGTTPVVNTVVAQVKNTSAASVQQPLMARFRLALWGSAPWSFPPPDGKWRDMRATVPTAAGQRPGICLGNSDPNAADSCSPAVNINPGAQAAIWFHYQLGADPALGASEYCQFGIHPPGSDATHSCTSCSCTAPGNHCDATSDTGTMSNVGAGGPCVSSYFGHQCMLVELSAPNGNVNFAQQSAWNNMNFDRMSVVAREALIDARQLPTRPGQRDQNIYLIAMPRNMPGSLPGGATDGALLIRQRALVRAEAVAAPYLADIAHQSDAKIREIAQRLGRPSVLDEGFAVRGSTEGKTQDPPDFRERIARVARALDVMPGAEFKRTSGLLKIAAASNAAATDLTQALVSQIGAIDAADVLPTLEIYPFYQPLGEGHAFQPMTAFTVFLSHEGALTGMNWAIDGATRIGHNIYQLRIPVGYARKIRVRAEAIEAGGALPPGNPAWPCAGGCAACGGANRSCGLVAALGSGGPGLLACVWVVGRRRKPKRR